jgi:UDP-N-acetylmuramoyl-L-alanyl-D-glutamate--2,6-diaminopimelate ligase
MMALSTLLPPEATLIGEDVGITGLALDSRKVRAGHLFAALPGQSADGRTYIDDALAAGAVAVLATRAGSQSTRWVLAHEPRRTLAQIARRFFGDPSATRTLVGITGTNGKTTTVKMVEHALSAAGRKVLALGTLSPYGLTTPDCLTLTALVQSTDADTVVMEVSSHALDQYRVDALSYDVAAFTNLTHDHLDYHGSLERYFAAKARLFGDRLKAGGKGVFTPGPWGMHLPDARPAPTPERVQARRDGTLMTVAGLTLKLPLLGRHNADNACLALAVLDALGLAPECARALETLPQVPGRMQQLGGAHQPLVVVDYAHSPDALARTLAALREVTPGRLLCVFGCGGDRDKTKRPVMGQVARAADEVTVTSDNPRSEDPRAIAAAIAAGHGYRIELDRRTAIHRAIAAATPRDTVLIAGKGHETYQVVGTAKLPFSDVAVAAEVLGA